MVQGRGSARLGIGALALVLLGVLLPAAGAPARRVPLPEAIELGRRVEQLVTVTNGGWEQDHATLRAWERTPSGWRLVAGPWRARLGPAGFVPALRRRQSTGTTPAGRFNLPYAFGVAPDPGALLEYRPVDERDWWPYEPRDPATYNIWQESRARGSSWRPGYAEHLADYPVDYAYAVVLGFNLPSGVRWSTSRRQLVADEPADTRRGGGIFLHVWDEPNTAGCISIARSRMVWLLRWLDPDARPRIVLGPAGWVRRTL